MHRMIRAGLLAVLAAALPAHSQLAPSTEGMRSVEAVEYTAKNQGSEAAIDLAAEKLKANPKNANVRFARAKLLASTGRIAEAKTAFESLIADHPEIPEPYNNLAAILASEGNLHGAEDLLKRAVQANPRFALGQSNLGDLYLALAEEAYRKAAAAGIPGSKMRLTGIEELRAKVARKLPPAQPSSPSDKTQVNTKRLPATSMAVPQNP